MVASALLLGLFLFTVVVGLVRGPVSWLLDRRGPEPGVRYEPRHSPDSVRRRTLPADDAP